MALTLSSSLAIGAGCSGSCPPTEPDRWNDCRDRLDSADCAIVLPVTVGDVPFDEMISCDGFTPADANDPCLWFPGPVGPVLRDGRFFYPFQSASTHGFRFTLEVEMTGADAGRGRFCRVEYTDVTEGCGLSNWTCASAGTIVLSAVPSSEPGSARSIRGEIHAEFPGGESVDAVF